MKAVKELDLIALLMDLPEYHLRRGDVGTVVDISYSGNSYEVEFMNAAGDTLAVLTLSRAEITPVDLKDARLHVNDAA